MAEIFQNRFPVSRKKPARLSLQFVRLYNADIDIAVGFGSTKGSNRKSLPGAGVACAPKNLVSLVHLKSAMF